MIRMNDEELVQDPAAAQLLVVLRPSHVLQLRLPWLTGWGPIATFEWNIPHFPSAPKWSCLFPSRVHHGIDWRYNFTSLSATLLSAILRLV